MKNVEIKSIYKVAAVCSLIIAISYLVIGVLVPLDPAESNRGDEFYAALREAPTIAMTWRPIFVLVGFLTIPFITAFSIMVRKNISKWAGIFFWVVILGYVGTVMQAVEWMREYFTIKAMVHFFPQGDRMYNVATEVASLPIDPDFLWKFGGLGLWYLCTAYIAYKGKMINKAATISGMGIGIGLITTMIFGITDTLITIGGVQIAVMQIPAALSGAVAAPIFHIIMTFTFFKHARSIKVDSSVGTDGKSGQLSNYKKAV